MTLKRTMCAILAASMLTTGMAVANTSASAAEVDFEESEAVAPVESEANPYALPDNIADGNIFHALNWKLSDIKAECKNIAAAGFTAVQTSPVQDHDGRGNWYWLYQPINFWPGNDNGSEDDLKALCAEAEKYNLKVVVDVVANHFAGNHSNIPDDLKGSEFYHNSGITDKTCDWSNRWQVTHCDIGMPDLNSEHSRVQEYVAKYVKQLKADGVDGIRWDAAKHIALPSEDCGFWPAVTGEGLYNYAEILDSPGGDGPSVMKEYTKYMSVTDNQYSNNTRGAFQGGNVMDGYGDWTSKGVPASGIVYWAESHDTFFNGMESQSANTYIINKAYAAIACRDGSQALYMSRPTGAWHHQEATYGVKGDLSAGTSKEVTAVNNFRNAMTGKKDYYLKSNGCAVITRQGGGAVIVKGDGNGYVKVTNGGENGVGYAKSGTYTDKISGNTFTVTSTTIEGTIGDTGIAVIYDGGPIIDDSDSDVVVSDTDTPSGEATIYFDNSAYNWSNVYAYVYDESTGKARQKAAWPGVKMTQKNSAGYLMLNVDDFANGMVIFTEGESSANRYPADMQPGLKIGGKSHLFKAGNSWVEYKDDVVTSDTDTHSDSDVVVSGVNAYFDNSAYNWSSVYAYVYDESTGKARSKAAWPGVKLTEKNSEGYLYVNCDDFANGMVIFTEGESSSNRYPADMQPGLKLDGKSHLFKANHEWVEYKEPQHVDSDTDSEQPDSDTDTSSDDKITVLCGDANQDGAVSLRDASFTLKASVDKATFKKNGKTAADVDGDGVITTSDALAIQRYDIGIASNKIGSKVTKKAVA